jgi:hypothetical protein
MCRKSVPAEGSFEKILEGSYRPLGVPDCHTRELHPSPFAPVGEETRFVAVRDDPIFKLAKRREYVETRYRRVAQGSPSCWPSSARPLTPARGPRVAGRQSSASLMLRMVTKAVAHSVSSLPLTA